MSPTFVVGDDLRAGTLEPLLPDYEALGNFSSHINAVYLPNRYLSPKVRAFVDFFVERFGPQPYWDRGLGLPGVEAPASRPARPVRAGGAPKRAVHAGS
ncbi:MAG: LysR substrate-binding domain-containing protein [bacterium]